MRHFGNETSQHVLDAFELEFAFAVAKVPMVTLATLIVVTKKPPTGHHICKPIFETVRRRRNGFRHLPDEVVMASKAIKKMAGPMPNRGSATRR